MTPDGTRATYARIEAADRALLAQAQALLDSGHREAARAVLRGVRVLTWRREKLEETMIEERKAA